MAIQAQYTDPSGEVYPEAYIEVVMFRWVKQDEELSECKLIGWANVEAKQNGYRQLFSNGYSLEGHSFYENTTIESIENIVMQFPEFNNGQHVNTI